MPQQLSYSVASLIVCYVYLARSVNSSGILLHPVDVSNYPAYIYGGPGQSITSSTLCWLSFDSDFWFFQFDVPTGYKLARPVNVTDIVDGDADTSGYVCRAQIDGVLVSGHTQSVDDKVLCTVHMVANRTDVFDVLYMYNAMLEWQPWSKLNKSVPLGAVSATSSGQIDDFFVARRLAAPIADPTTGNFLSIANDYHIGHFAPKQNHGQVCVIADNAEKCHDDGEILIEIEPASYELRHIRKSRTQMWSVTALLGSVVLQNDGDTAGQIERSIAFEHLNETDWGWSMMAGVSRGKPVKVHETGKPVVQIAWGIPEVLTVSDTRTVEAHLLPGTAVNVSMYANYTKCRENYSATMIMSYNTTPKTIREYVKSTLTSKHMEDVFFVFGPVYFVHNYTLVPTTTSTLIEARRPLDEDVDNDNQIDEEPVTDDMSELAAAAAGASFTTGYLTRPTSALLLMMLLILTMRPTA